MLKIYGADLSTPSNKVRFTANYLGLEYEYIRVRIKQGDHRKKEFLALNPVGKIPVIEDDGFTLFESNAIIRYLCEKHQSSLYPEGATDRAVVNQWMDFISIHIGGALNKIVFNRIFYQVIGTAIDERSLQDGVKFLNRFFPVVDNRLRKGKFLLSDKMSLADLTLLSTIDPAEVAEIDLSLYPRLTRWREGMMRQEFYQRCHEKYATALERSKILTNKEGSRL